MAGITLTDAEEKLALWLAADEAVSTGQEYTISTGTGGRTLKRADAGEITRKIEFWNGQVQRLSRGGIRVRGATPV